MRFQKQLLAAGLIGASLAATAPARAQEVLHVVDAHGRPVGVLIRAPQPVATLTRPDLSIFAAMDRIMAYDMAMMEAQERQFIEMAARTAPASMQGGQAEPDAGTTIWQSYSTFSAGAPSLNCARTIVITQNGNAAPIVHAASTGDDRACARLGAPAPVQGPTAARPKQDIVPAIDTGPAASAHGRQTPF